MRRRWRWVVLVLALALPVLVVAGMRMQRPSFRPPVAVHGGVLRVRNFFTEIYGARAGAKVVLFDAGVDPAGGAVDALLAALHASCDDVSDVFLTHGHFDHVAAAPHCPKARIRVGAPDVDLLAHRVPAARLAPRLFERVLPVPPIVATDPLRALVELPLPGGKAVLVIPFPGHTPGSYLYLYEGVLFAGDSLQIDGDALDFAMSPFSADMDANRRNVARLRALLTGAPVAVVCTGHQGCTRPGEARRMIDALIARASR